MSFLISFLLFSGAYFWAIILFEYGKSLYRLVKIHRLEHTEQPSSDTVGEGRGSERSERARTKAP